MRKALYFDILQYREENLARLREMFEIVTRHSPAEATDADLAVAEVIFAPLGYCFDDAFFARTPLLKVLATNTTGVPHIDCAAAALRGIQVYSLRDEREFLNTITPTAEHTIGLMLAVTRHLVPAYHSVMQGKWSRWQYGGDAMLSRMKLGIVGMGRLGSMVARFCSVLGTDVSYYDPYISHDPSWTCVRCESLRELVSKSDIVSVHIPMNEENRHFFNRSVFHSFKRGSYFINTARGEVVDSDALVDALEEGIVKGAALDVLDGEFSPDFQERVLKHPLVKYAQRHPNLIITPHIAGSTEDAWTVTQRFVIEKAIAYFEGQKG